jgi:rubredoxin
LHPLIENGEQVKQMVVARPTRGRLACDPKRITAPVTRNGITVVTPRSDNPVAVNCPKCMVSKDYTEMMAKQEVAK